MKRIATPALLGSFALAAACTTPAGETGGDPAARPDLWSAHLERVEDELERNTPPGKDEAARHRVVEALRAYRARGDFPVADTDSARERTFRDPAGRT